MMKNQSADALLKRGLDASAANDSALAIDLFAKASAADPSAGLPHFLIASEFAAGGDMAKAEAAFANAILLAPNFSIARYQLGLLQFSSGRAAVALLTWQPLLQLHNDEPLPHFVRGFEELAHDAFEEALTHFRNGLARNASNQALSQDVRKVMEGIVAAQTQNALAAQTATGISTPLINASQVPAAEDTPEQSHVLLANYQQQGPAH